MDNPFSLTGKMILVTGASSGIGQQTAVSISKMGGTLLLTGRNEKRLADTFAMLEGDGHQMIVADLLDEKKRNELVEQMPQLNGMAYCAGILQPFPVKFITQKQIDEMLSVNFDAPVLLTGSLLKQKKFPDKASLVFISSISSSLRPYFGGALYTASKAALEAFSRAVAIEHARQGIRSNCILPAIIKTPIFNEYMGSVASHENVENYEKKYPLGFGEPVDVANAAVYLLSDAAKWVTGTNMILDGGLMVV
ncbi:MAG TPA: SDR family oxidoreductase [Bacteroidales bacterium]|nr:SDR family oxidoreductase [Bacteroidales bacterium]